MVILPAFVSKHRLAGLVPAIHVERRRNAERFAARRRVDARHKAGHDADRMRVAYGAGKFAKPSYKSRQGFWRAPSNIRQRFPQSRQVLRQFAFKQHLFAGDRMFESERRGVQRLPA